jgi:hypothetical protein
MLECPQNKDTETYLAYTDEPEILMKVTKSVFSLFHLLILHQHFRKRVETYGH